MLYQWQSAADVNHYTAAMLPKSCCRRHNGEYVDLDACIHADIKRNSAINVAEYVNIRVQIPLITFRI